jgi:nitrogen fixation NifU-like protein
VDRQLIIDNLLDHAENPRNYGRLEDADVVQEGGNPGCGDVVTIYLKVNPEDDTVQAVRFEGEGCTISQAATSIVTQLVTGKPLAEVEDMDYNALLNALGRDVVMARVRCATLGLGTIKGAVKRYASRQSLAEAESAGSGAR